MAKGYMPQRVFNVGTFTIGKLFFSQPGLTWEGLASQIADAYRNDYIDDGFEQDWIAAAYRVIPAALEQFSNDKLPGFFTHLQYAAANYDLEGRWRRRRWFGGTWFSKEKQSNPHRVEECFRSFLIYSALIFNGRIPYPKGGDWHGG